MPKGITTKQVMEMDLRELHSLPLPQLKQYAKMLFDTANKRVKRISEYMDSPAARSFKSSGGVMFSAGGVTDKNAIIHEMARAKQFLNYKTSTVSGFKKYDKMLKETLEKVKKAHEKARKDYDEGEGFGDDDLTVSQMWEWFHRAQEQGLFVPGTYAKEDIANIIAPVYAESQSYESFINKIKGEDIDNFTDEDEEDDGGFFTI